jgi:hypothetical protein
MAPQAIGIARNGLGNGRRPERLRRNPFSPYPKAPVISPIVGRSAKASNRPLLGNVLRSPHEAAWIREVALLRRSWSVRDAELEQPTYVTGKPSARPPRREGPVEFGGREPATRLKPLSHCTTKLLSDLGSGLENWLKVRFREFIHSGGSNRGNIRGSVFAR